MQPPIVAECKAGKALGAVSNFSATFNWVVNFCRNLRGDELSVTVDRTDTNHPVVRMVRNDTPLAPFVVRWSDADSSLVVYLPEQSCNLANTQVLLTPATDTDWYIVAGGSTGTSTDGTTLRIHAHVKGRVKATSNGTIQPAIFVEAYDATTTHNDNYNAGDLWSAEIARCTVTARTEGGTTTYVRAVSKMHTGAVTHLSPVVLGDLPLYWYTDTAIATNGFVPHIEECSAPYCYGTLADTALPPLPNLDYMWVWYVVDCSGNTPTPSIVRSDDDGTPPVPASQRYYTVTVPVYSLINGCLSWDTRSRLAQEVYYP